MGKTELSKEEQILQVLKKVLTDIARETHTKPGLKHPLSDDTLVAMRDCLALISAREQELTEAAGRESKMRPRYIDEPAKSVVIPLDTSGLSKKKIDNDKSPDKA